MKIHGSDVARSEPRMSLGSALEGITRGLDGMFYLLYWPGGTRGRDTKEIVLINCSV